MREELENISRVEHLKTTFKKAAGVLITCNNCVVLTKRIKNYKGQKVPYGGYWSPFAGIIEEGEDPRDTAIRELKEESGVKAEKKDLVFLDDFSSPERFFTLYALEVKEFPKITLCEEHTDLGYFVIDSLQELPLEYKIDPGIAKSIQRYKKIFPKKI